MPAYTASPPLPPHPNNNIHRSWSDEQVPVTSYSSEPIRPAPRSSSFSASRAPQFDWRNNPPPPPVPPLPPALLPGFHSPPLVHSNLDFTFTEAPRRPPPPQPRPGPYTGPDVPQSITPSRPPLVQDSPPIWSSIGQRNNYFPSNSSFGSPEPPAPWPANNYVSNTPGLGDRRPSSYALAQSCRISDQSPSPPPAIPPRPITTQGEIRSERPPMPPQAAAPPPVPPKTLTFSTTSSLMFPSRDDPQTSSSQDNIGPSSSDAQPIPEAQETRPAEASEVDLPKAAEAGPFEVPETRAPEVPESGPLEAPETGPPEVSGAGLPEYSEAAPLEVPEKGKLPSTSATQATETSPLDSDFKRAMTLSLAESQRKQSVRKSQEEDDDDELARALAESLSLSTNLQRYANYSRDDPSSSTRVTQLDTGSDSSLMRVQGPNESGTSRRRPSVPDSDLLSPEELEDHAAHGQIMQELEDEEVTRRLQEEEERRAEAELQERERQAEARERLDEALTKRLQEEEARRLDVERLERERQDEERARLDAELARREAVEERARKMIQEAQERKDAEMARRMAETNEAERPHTSKGAFAAQGTGSAPAGPSPPQYTEVMGSPPRMPMGSPPPLPMRYTRPTARPVQSSPQLYHGSPQLTRRAASAHASQQGQGPSRPAEQGDRTRSATVNGNAFGGGNRNNGTRPGSGPSQSAPANGNSAGPSRGGPGAGPSGPGPSPVRSANRPRTSPGAAPGVAPSAAPSVVSEGDAIGSDVLKGVAYGFKPPDTKSAPTQSGVLPVCPPFPEVITLFRSPSPPFYIMATSWRHLMRLLAQLETRIQANLEVIANSKEENLLRVVVQFVKLPYTANTWRTIVHLTLDQPVPRNLQKAWRFTNGDTMTPPYSYPPLPYLVNNSQSQFYVIPLSATSPLPILPITLPNLALYLQSAMRDSRARKVQNDPSNGMRRLARMVTACYPEEMVVPDKEERRPARGVGNLLKRVVGLGGGTREDSQENEEVYDIITPFRIDQYTAS